MSEEPGATRMQSLGRGLAVLDQLVRADGPLTSTEVGRRCGVHQTTASRILGELVAAGYARRVSYREFAPDYGLLALGLEASRHFALLSHPRPALERAARMCRGLQLSLCLLWRDRLLYFDQAASGLDTRPFTGRDYPLHLSSPGLLFLLDLPRDRALAALAASEQKFGWARPTPRVPATAAEVLGYAGRLQRQGTLVLLEWAQQGHVSAAVRLGHHQGHPLALTISGAGDVMSTETLRIRLHEARRMVEPSLRTARER